MPAVTHKKLKAYNPQGNKPKRKSTNAAGLMTLAMAGNPQKKEKSMKKKHKSKPAAKQTSGKPKARPKAKNPQALAPPRKKHKKSGNPNFLKTPIDNLKFGAAAAAGLVATMQLPQLVLKENNTGWKGYLANLGTATTAGVIAGLANKQLGWAVAIGGSMYVIVRFLTENVSVAGKYFRQTGIGDAAAAGMGELEDGYFPVPVITDANNQPMIPEAILRAAVAASLQSMELKQRQAAAAGQGPTAAPSAGVSGVPSRYRRAA